LPALGAQLTILAFGKLPADLIGDVNIERGEDLVHSSTALRAVDRIGFAQDQPLKDVLTFFTPVFVERHCDLLSSGRPGSCVSENGCTEER
jgi:hypothetical protein